MGVPSRAARTSPGAHRATGSSSKLIMTDVFSGAMPAVVTSAFATSYVAALGSANSAGRLGWAVASDQLGRKASERHSLSLSLPLPRLGILP